MRITEEEFNTRLEECLDGLVDIGAVTGPGRSGAIAAVYASHFLGVPFLPFGSYCSPKLGRLLIIDTAVQTRKTLRKAAKDYASEELDLVLVAVYQEPPRVRFWYER